MPTDYWVDDSAVHSVAATGTIDAYCNLATLIFAKIANLIAESRQRSAHSADQASTANDLWRELQDWRTFRPKQVLPLLRSAAYQNGPFQTIIYTHSSSSKAKHCPFNIVLTVVLVCGNTFFHAGSILLLQTGDVRKNGTSTETDNVSGSATGYNDYYVVLTLQLQYDPVWHAKELGGISTSNASQYVQLFPFDATVSEPTLQKMLTNCKSANWVNHLHPLYIAGKAFGSGSARRQSVSSPLAEDETSGEDERPAEKFALLKHLAKIERETGWKTSSRAAELRRFWGIE